MIRPEVGPPSHARSRLTTAVFALSIVNAAVWMFPYLHLHAWHGIDDLMRAQSTSFDYTLIQKTNVGPSNGLGVIGWQNAQPTILNDWSPPGLAAKTRQMVSASDNQATMITGIDSSGMAEGDELEICNQYAPADAGVIALRNEDSRSLANNRILVPGTGRFGAGIQMSCIIDNAQCALLRWGKPDPVNNASVSKWMVLSPCGRSTSPAQAWFLYPSLTTGPLTGTYNDYNFGNVDTSDSGPQGYATTIAIGSNGQSLPQATINVASTAGFQTQPITANHPLAITVLTANGVQAVNCTGTSGGNQFTGCSGGSGSMTTGNAVAGGLCLAGGSCHFDEYTTIKMLTLNSTGVTITGMHYATVSDPEGLGPVKVLINYGPGTITLSNQNAGSSQNNRFLFPYGTDVTLQINQSIALVHDGAFNYWQPVGGIPPPSTYSQTNTSMTMAGNTSLVTEQNLAIGPAIQPSALTSGSQTNNWDPTGTGAGTGNAKPLFTWIRAVTSATGTATISGMIGPGAGVNPGLQSIICNFGTGPIKILNQSASSAAGNRFFLPFTLSFNPSMYIAYGQCIEFVYDNNGNWWPMSTNSENTTSIGTIPTLSSCGTGSPTIVGTNSWMTVTEGTTTTTCTITFADGGFDTFADVPTCNVTPMNVAPGTAALTYTVSRTAIVLTNASATGDVFAISCGQTKN